MFRPALFLCVFFGACASGPRMLQAERLDAPSSAPEDWADFPTAAPGPGPGELIAARAGALSGLSSLRSVNARLPDDCTGLVRAAYEAAGVDLMGEGERGDNGVTAMYRKAERLGALHARRPSPGDLVFFRETYDRDRNGRFDDGLTHVAVVESVEPTGTVVFVHRGGTGITRARLTLWAPDQRLGPAGEVLNDFLRPQSRRSRAYLSGELFVHFADVGRLQGSAAAFSLR